MSKPAANPFFEVDFSKFADFSRLASEFKSPMSFEPMLAAQRRNIEAFTAVNQAAFESMQSLIRRQADLMRQGMEDAASLMSAMMSCPTPQEKVMRHAEASKMAMEKYLANARDVAETLSKCNSQAMEAVSNRLNEGLEELRGMMKPRQEAA
jgi:phasin family protein